MHAEQTTSIHTPISYTCDARHIQFCNLHLIIQLHVKNEYVCIYACMNINIHDIWAKLVVQQRQNTSLKRNDNNYEYQFNEH